MPETSPFLAHYQRLDDEELIEHWQKQLLPEARTALQSELRRRELQVPEGSVEHQQNEDFIESASDKPGDRTIWWRWLKAYGALAPVFILSVLRNSAGLSTGAVWAFLLSGAGYALAVVWIVKTQSVNPPWSKGMTITSFVFVHFLLMLCLLFVIRGLWSVGHP